MNFVKTLIIFFLLLGSMLPLSACFIAYQQRIFPLGELDDNPVFMESLLERDSKRAKGVETVFFKGLIRTVAFQNNSWVVIDTLEKAAYVTQEDYSEYLNQFYSTALEKLEKQTGFQTLKNSIKLCSASNTCKGYTLKHTSDSVFISHDAISYAMAMPEHVSSAASFITGSLQSFQFNILSIRTFKAGDAEFAVITLSGGDPYDILEAELKNRKKIMASSLPAYPEIIYPHGIGFDILLNIP